VIKASFITSIKAFLAPFQFVISIPDELEDAQIGTVSAAMLSMQQFHENAACLHAWQA
jgi:hypothetical protein